MGFDCVLVKIKPRHQIQKCFTGATTNVRLLFYNILVMHLHFRHVDVHALYRLAEYGENVEICLRFRL